MVSHEFCVCVFCILLLSSLIPFDRFSFSLFSSFPVLKSDSAYGVFGFSVSSLSGSVQEPGNLSLLVVREKGDYERVTVRWEVREGSSEGTSNVTDFSPSYGELVFQPGDREKSLLLVTVNENVPELDESFVVVLLSAVANDDDLPDPTPTSGASVNSSLAQSQVTVSENDYPYGLLQFVEVPPSPEDLAGPFLPAAVSTPNIFVMESDMNVTVYVVRAQGVQGTVRAEYFSEDGTAKGAGTSPDYVPVAGVLTFELENRVQSFEVSLVDDSVPELGKVFYLELTNPTGGVLSAVCLCVCTSTVIFKTPPSLPPSLPP